MEIPDDFFLGTIHPVENSLQVQDEMRREHRRFDDFGSFYYQNSASTFDYGTKVPQPQRAPV